MRQSNSEVEDKDVSRPRVFFAKIWLRNAHLLDSLRDDRKPSRRQRTQVIWTVKAPDRHEDSLLHPDLLLPACHSLYLSRSPLSRQRVRVKRVWNTVEPSFVPPFFVCVCEGIPHQLIGWMYRIERLRSRLWQGATLCPAIQECGQDASEYRRRIFKGADVTTFKKAYRPRDKEP